MKAFFLAHGPEHQCVNKIPNCKSLKEAKVHRKMNTGMVAFNFRLKPHLLEENNFCTKEEITQYEVKEHPVMDWM